MKHILILLLLAVTILSLRFKAKRQCKVVINGVDIQTKVKGNIVGYKGSKPDFKNSKVEVTVVVEQGKNG